MKKLVVSLLVALLLTSGGVAVSGSPASADPDCPNSDCAGTRVTTGATVDQKRNRARIKVKVEIFGSSVEPQGRVTLTIVKMSKNGNLEQIEVMFGRINERGRISFETDRLRRGRYAYAAEFESNEKRGSAYDTDNGFFRLR